MKVIKYKTMFDEYRHPKLIKVSEYEYHDEKFTNAKKICELMTSVFRIDKETEEYMYELCFTTDMKLLGVFELSHGTINSTLISPREVFLKALICGAATYVIVHNHPSGDSTPSRNDKQVTKRLKDLGEMMEFKLTDSIIIGDGEMYSFRENEWKEES